jgi:hypothetical protein
MLDPVEAFKFHYYGGETPPGAEKVADLFTLVEDD